MTVQIISEAEFLYQLEQIDFCRYDPDRKLVEVTEEIHSDQFYYDIIYRKLVKFLTNFRPEGDLFYYPKVSEVALSFYSGCLLRYVIDVIDLGINHTNTCWYQKCENCRLISFVGNKSTFDYKAELNRSTLKDSDKLLNNFSSLTSSSFNVDNGWLKYNDPNINNIILGLSEKIKYYVKFFFGGKYDRSINLISNIRKHGFDEKAAYGNKLGVFGFSENTKDYSVFHGKHRVVALMYLVSKGELPADLRIKYPIVSYKFPHFGNSSGLKCLSCGLQKKI